LVGLVILALLGIEVPLNLGVEIVHIRPIRKYLLWGSIAVMAAYLWATLGTMLSLNPAKSQAATTDILRAVQVGFWGSHAFASAIGADPDLVLRATRSSTTTRSRAYCSCWAWNGGRRAGSVR
jgi:hypothetical protein